MPIDTQESMTISCDNPNCPVRSGAEQLPTGMSDTDKAGWLLVQSEVYGMPTQSHVFCSPPCAAAVADAFAYIRDVTELSGNAGDVVKITGFGFAEATGIMVGPVEGESFAAIDDNNAEFTVPSLEAELSGQLVMATPNGAILSFFAFTIAADPNFEPPQPQ